MGARHSAEESPPTSPVSPRSPRVMPKDGSEASAPQRAEFARRILSKSHDDDALPARSSAPVQRVSQAPPMIPPSKTVGDKPSDQFGRAPRRGEGIPRRESGLNLNIVADLLDRINVNLVNLGSEKPHRNGTLVLKGAHTREIYAMATLGGGKLASAGADGVVFIWSVDCEDNILVGELTASLGDSRLSGLVGHTESIYSLASLQNGRLASGGKDKKIIIWNIEASTQLLKLEGHMNSVTCLATLEDARFASGSDDKTIIIWSVVEGVELQGMQLAKLEGHAGKVRCLAALDGDRLASGGKDKGLIIWSIADGKQLTHIEGHSDDTDDVQGLAVLDGGRLASAGGIPSKFGGNNDFSIRIWNVADGAQVDKLEGHTNSVSSLAKLHDGRLASASWDKTIIIWSVEGPEAGTQVAKLRGHTAAVWCLAVHDGGQLVSGGKSDDSHENAKDSTRGAHAHKVSSGENTIRVRPVLHTSAYKFATCNSANEFEEVARECRERKCLGELIDAVSVQQLAEGCAETSVDDEITTQAQVFDAIARVAAEEVDPSYTINSIRPSICGLIKYPKLLRGMYHRGVSYAAIEQLAQSPLFRVVINAKYAAAGTKFVLYFECFVAFILMFLFGRVVGIEVLHWSSWWSWEETLAIVLGFAILAYFSAREIYQLLSTRAIELASPEAHLRDYFPTDGSEKPAKKKDLEYYSKVSRRYIVLLIFLPPLLLLALVRNVLVRFSVLGAYDTHWAFIRDFKNTWANGFNGNVVTPIFQHITFNDPLTSFGFSRVWRRDYWNYVDVAMLACCWASFVRAAMPGTHLSTNLAVATSMLLWIKVLTFLRFTTKDLAIFAAVMIDRIVYDLSSFLIFFGIIILMFACAFYLYLGPRHHGDFEFHDDEGSNKYHSFAETMYSLYLFGFVGDFDRDNFDRVPLKWLLVFFVAIVSIVLLNVLIAIVGLSYQNARDNGTGIYYRLKIELILDVYHPAKRFLPKRWLSPASDESIKKLLEDALKEYKIKASTTWEFQDTKRALRVSKEQTNQKLEAMEAKINKIADMLQKLLEKEQS